MKWHWVGLSWQSRPSLYAAPSQAWPARARGFQITSQILMFVIVRVGKKDSGPVEPEKADAKPKVFSFFHFSRFKLRSRLEANAGRKKSKFIRKKS